jgi:hypothetical protein
MKTHLSTLHSRFTYFVFVAFTIGLFSSCAKENPVYADIPSARLMAYNLAPDLQEVAFTVGTVPVSGALRYTEHTVNYVPVEAGDRQLGAFNVNGGVSLASQTAAFSENAEYSAYLIGSNGVYRTVLSLDNNGRSNRSDANAWVRYVHAISGSSNQAEVNIAGQTVQAAYGVVSDYQPLQPGTATVAIRSGDTFETSQTINFEQGKQYSILFVGKAGSTDPQKAPQVKLIME